MRSGLATTTDKAQANSEDSNIWSSILQQVQQIGTKKLASNKNILVLGDNESGKTSLIAKMAGVDSPKRGSGLEYNYLEIRDEYRDESTKLGCWILNGDEKHENLLNFALTEENFENTYCLLVASMSEPWNILSCLEKWTRVLESRINNLKLQSHQLTRCKHQLVRKFVEYVSPGDEIVDNLITHSNSRYSRASVSEDDTLTQTMRTNENKYEEDSENLFADNYKELSENTLTLNLGIEIIVVITKTDHMVSLEKDFDYNEETFDFIQQAIRKYCLKLGASLFYVSAKVNKNCDLLYKFLAHRIYDLPFSTPALVVEKDAIFIPAGWDNEKKISILYENIRNANPDDAYNDFIVKRVNTKPIQRDTEVLAEDDQTFLARMQSYLSVQQGKSPRDAHVTATAANLRASNVATPSPVQSRPVDSRRSVGSNSSSTQISVDNSPAGEGVLQTFFNSLLSRGRVRPTDGSPIGDTSGISGGGSPSMPPGRMSAAMPGDFPPHRYPLMHHSTRASQGGESVSLSPASSMSNQRVPIQSQSSTPTRMYQQAQDVDEVSNLEQQPDSSQSEPVKIEPSADQ